MSAQPATNSAECWLLDVGQGTANVILLGQGRAIVIDCGPRHSTAPLDLLKRYVTSIELLLVSHNDVDHDGGAARTIAAYPKAIKRLMFLADRPASQIRPHMVALRERQAGNLICEPERLELGRRPKTLYSDSATGLKLTLLGPTFTENLEAEQAGSRRANRTSAVMRLSCGQRTVLFSADATRETWEALATRLARRLPLPCDVMTVPHHGGHIVPRSGKTDAAYEAEERQFLRRLYSEIVAPRFAVVSVGTSNRFHGVTHPMPATIDTLRQLGVKVLCTEMTPHCCNDLEALRPGPMVPRWPSQSSSTPRQTPSGRSKDVGCASTVVVELSDKTATVSMWQQHQTAIDREMTAGRIHPLCRVS